MIVQNQLWPRGTNAVGQAGSRTTSSRRRLPGPRPGAGAAELSVKREKIAENTIEVRPPTVVHNFAFDGQN